MTRISALGGLDAATYRRSDLHSEERVWVEKNCYIDICIELIHALNLDPRAMLSFVFGLDFEGDQWTFFKPVHEELRTLYGIDIQELNVWRPLIEHAQEHLVMGRLISAEADAYWLPDTAGTDYRTKHAKTTIVIESLDLEAGTLGYFHNSSYHQLGGEDFRRTFRLDTEPDPTFLPLFAEFVRVDRLVHRSPKNLAEASIELLRRHVGRRTLTNPIDRFESRFNVELPKLQALGIDHYHAWAFATIRQLGAAFELAAIQLDWLVGLGHVRFDGPAHSFARIAANAKALILKAARAVITRKPLSSNELFHDASTAWQHGMRELDAALS